MTASQATIGIIEDDRILREQIAWSLKRDYRVVEAGTREDGVRLLRADCPDLVLLDMHLPPSGTIQEGIALIREAHRAGLDTVFIMMAGSDQRESAQQAIREGAHDFFPKPFELADLRFVIQRALDRLRIERENRHLRTELQGRYAFSNIIGNSAAMQRVFEAIRRVCDSALSVMIRGESGTGKELVARAIHFNSPRRNGPFVGVNCGAIPAGLVESELFGHERGAFTGAVSARKGRFELADGGAVFLDEIGTLSPDLQARLLRVLETRAFERVGGACTLGSDFRLISATHEDLEARVAAGTFREDLYYRLKVFPIHLPPLRERREDIPILVSHFLRRASQEHGVPVKQVDPEALQVLIQAPWRGNVRELENLLQTLALMVEGSRIGVSDLPAYVRTGMAAPPAALGLPGHQLSIDREMERYELDLIQAALARAGGSKIAAARFLGVDKNRMMYLCRKHGLVHRMKSSTSTG